MAYLIAVGLLALIGYVALFSAERHPRANGGFRVAVLPIFDLDGDSTQSYIADGLTEQLITELAQLPGIEVINRRTMVEYHGKHTSVPEILRKLNANALLTASIQRLADTVHMTAELIRSGDAKASWARSFDGTRADLLRMQQRIALLAARSLGVASEPYPSAPTSRDPAAIDLYIRGRYAWNQRGGGPLLFDDAMNHERRAQQLDPLSVPIAGTAGWVLYCSGKHQAAARELHIALRENSAFPLGHFYLGRVFEARGQLDSALVQYAATGAQGVGTDNRRARLRVRTAE